MKLKLSKKAASPAKEAQPSETVPAPAQETAKLFTDGNGQRRYNTQMFAWQEVFATGEKDEADKVKMQFYRLLLSSFMVFDFDAKQFVVMTTETFYSDARRVVLDLGFKPWGVGDE